MTPARLDVHLRAETRAIDPPVDLLEHLGAGGFAWFGDGVSFVTAGVVAELEASDVASFLGAVDHDAPAAAPDAAGPLAVGALSFSGHGRLVVPARVVGVDAQGRAWTTSIEHRIAAGVARYAPPTRFRVEASSTSDEWAAAVEEVLRAIDAHHVHKVVLAREVRVVADAPFDLTHVLTRLRRTQPGCFVFAADGLVGATPELLVRRSAANVTCRPMAGTVARHADAADLRSNKNGREHDYVASTVIAELQRWCTDVHAAEPAPASFADVTHLVTEVQGVVGDDATSALDIARALHPTPAVAGTPRGEALRMIERLEPAPRGNYAGPVGWVGANGDGEFAVALRCAQIDGRNARLHAGAGIVAGSDPDAEWEETSVKFEPMLRALVRP